jgi:hypothetical protein
LYKAQRKVADALSTVNSSRSIRMAKKTTASKKSRKAGVAHPGMMGDGTEEQNLNERGNPAARIKKKEVTAAFGKARAKK